MPRKKDAQLSLQEERAYQQRIDELEKRRAKALRKLSTGHLDTQTETDDTTVDFDSAPRQSRRQAPHIPARRRATRRSTHTLHPETKQAGYQMTTGQSVGATGSHMRSTASPLPTNYTNDRPVFPHEAHHYGQTSMASEANRTVVSREVGGNMRAITEQLLQTTERLLQVEEENSMLRRKVRSLEEEQQVCAPE